MHWNIEASPQFFLCEEDWKFLAYQEIQESFLQTFRYLIQQLYTIFALLEERFETPPALSGFDPLCSQRNNIASDRFYRMHTKQNKLNSPNCEVALQLYRPPQEAASVKRISPSSSWPLYEPCACPPLLVTLGTQVQPICLCSVGQTHPFIRCSTTSSKLELTVPLQSPTS